MMDKQRDPHNHMYTHDSFRIERRWRQEPNGSYLWTVYKRVATGADGNKPGVHPIIKNEHGTPIDTIEPFVWIDIFTGSEQEARRRYDAERQGN